MSLEEEKALRETVGALLESPAEDVPELLIESGWRELVEEDERLAVTVLFGEHGRRLGNAAILDQELLSHLTLEGDATVLYRAQRVNESIEGVTLIQPESGVLVAELEGDVFSFPVTDANISPLETFDENARWFRTSVDAASGTPLASGEWVAAEAAGRRALSAELLGVGREMLRLTIEHTSSREQYGRAIGSFQSVRHRIADVHTALDAGEALLHESFGTENPVGASLAKASASRAVALATKHCVQVFGAVGLTKEHQLHRYVARGVILDWLLGSQRELTAELGRTILTTGEAPILTEV